MGKKVEKLNQKISQILFMNFLMEISIKLLRSKIK